MSLPIVSAHLYSHIACTNHQLSLQLHKIAHAAYPMFQVCVEMQAVLEAIRTNEQALGLPAHQLLGVEGGIPCGDSQLAQDDLAHVRFGGDVCSCAGAAAVTFAG